MILPPFSAPKDFKTGIRPPAAGDACWVLFSGNQLLVGADERSLPTHHDFVLQRSLYLGSLRNKHYFAGEVEAGTEPPSGWIWSPLRPLYAALDEERYAIAGRAMQLLHWDRSNAYCGRCGHATVSREEERCRECKSCGQLAYPKLSLAILALIRRGSQVLLARSPQFPEPFYSTLAGFVDPGETLEQCVMREVLEEVSLHVKNVLYFGSQPWPFSYSMMIGFTCEWEKGEIQINPAEIEDAAWFDLSDLPRLPPVYSLSRILIDQMAEEQ